MFYNGLTELDSHLGAKMALAESLDTKDATVWVVKLRNGVQFHDGKPLTPADVVYSIMRHKDPATASKAKTLADQIKEVKATGPNEVTITLEGRERRPAGDPRHLALPDHQGRHEGFQNGYRHRSVQGQGILAGRAYGRREEPELLEAGSAASRRSRTDRHRRRIGARERAAFGRRATDQRGQPALDRPHQGHAGVSPCWRRRRASTRT